MLSILHDPVCDTGIILPRVHFTAYEGFVQKGTKQRAMGERDLLSQNTELYSGLKEHNG